ncbi:MAG: c-type cytochrome [Vicinamibacteria bacterium]|jgi:cbb3-type cytochrome oxidase cytochrome c subunit|nr:c-type cytochrome [Vicinamibacteria bacterium]MBP9944921.1 c-type cytochrome [Vicinamibacteria bacterium]
MEKRTNSPYPRIDRPVLAIVGVLLVISTILFARNDREHEWRWYQAEFKRLVTEKYGADKAKTVPTGLQQIWIPSMAKADRCVTCHQALGWKGFETADEPFRTHPQEILKSHPPETFGCTSCHGGQGWAIDAEPAHGPVEHWTEPVLGKQLGEAYTLVDNKAALLQMNCNVCHRYERETKGADVINHAKQLVNDKGCRGCHVVNGRGGAIGPDLTYVGDKEAEQYEFGRLSGQKTSFAWHVAHFKDPRALVAETVMPNFNFSSKDAQSLAMLMLSWRKRPVPAAFIPGVPDTEPQTVEEREAEERMKTGPGGWFVKTGCFVCHSISSLGVKSPAQIGPDLSTAVEDVQSRFGRTLDDFIREPTGTMAVVLSRQIILSPEEKAVAVSKLREAYAEHEKQKASAAKAGKPAAPVAARH